MRDKTGVLVLIGVGMVCTIAGVVILGALNRPTSEVLIVMVPIMSGLIALVSAKVDSVSDKVNDVRQQTNGQLSRAMELLAQSPAITAERNEHEHSDSE